MPFCPTCRTEYRAEITDCADCKVALVAELPADVGAQLRLVEFYECYDQGEALRAVALLTDDGIAAMMRDNSSSSFPTTVGTSAARRVLVDTGKVGEARGLLEAARSDEVISTDGRFLKHD